MFQECFNEVLFCDFVVAWISSQLPQQKEGLLSICVARETLENTVKQIGLIHPHTYSDTIQDGANATNFFIAYF